MENENDNFQDEDISELPEVGEGQEDTTDWKAEALKYQGLAKRYKTKAEKAKETPAKSEANKPEKKDASLDYGQLAFYNSKSNTVKIEADEDIDYLKQVMEETGKSQADILNSKWFSAEIKERAEIRASDKAVPAHGERIAKSGKDTVEYWLGKGELPSDSELRMKVVNARIAREKGANSASGPSVVSNASGIMVK